MTWVIGTAGVRYPFMIGDIRISWGGANGNHSEDCIQKIYPLKQNVLGGFAGSVILGMETLWDIGRQGWEACPLDEMVHGWVPEVMREHFNRAPDVERKCGSEFLLVGYHPTEEYAPGVPRTAAFRFKSPQFEPERFPFNRCIGIGSGHYVEQLRAEAERLYESMSKSATHRMSPTVFPMMFAEFLRQSMQKTPQESISEWFVWGTVTPNGYRVEPLRWNVNTPEGTKEIGAPPIARSLEELAELLEQRGHSANAAIA
jgi:hypothetical protein